MNLAAQTNSVVSSAGAVAGTTAVNGTHVDMLGWDGVVFVAVFGTLTATQVTALKAQNGDLANDTDMVDITGAASAALADGDGGKAIVLDVYRAQHRYVRPVVTRGTANAVVQAVLAIQYMGKRVPPGSTADGATPFAGIDATVKQVLILPGV
jgi:hypothetical protein